MSALSVFTACRQVGSAPTQDGQISFQMIAPPPQPMAVNARPSADTAAVRDVFVKAEPILPLANPLYPAAARAAKIGVVTVSVHLVVDSSGRVSTVTPSLASFSLPTRFSSEFQAAVETAVRQWRFTPAEIKHLESAPGENGQPYQRVASQEKIEAACDVLFTFTATGEVWAGLPPKSR